MTNSRAINAAAEAIAATGTSDLLTLASAAVKAAAPFIRAAELNRCVAAAEELDATYPAERDPAPEQRRAVSRDGRYPFSEYLEDTYDGEGTHGT